MVDQELSIGFVILSHRGSDLLGRLIEVLNEQYHTPPIAVHQDFGQDDLAGYEAPDNVRFVRPHVATGWGRYGVVEGALKALRLLYDTSDPDWFFLLSAADYPAMPGAAVRAELANAAVDAFMDIHDFGGAQAQARLVGSANPQLSHFDNPPNRRMTWGRYVGAQLWLPILRRKPSGGLRLGRYTLHLPYRAFGSPFTPERPCFYGDHWFAGNRRVAQILLQPDRFDGQVERALKHRSVPEEAYYHSVLCARPELTISRDNRRFAEWNGGGAHPSDLTPDNTRRAFAAKAFFARKYTPGSPALDTADRLLHAEDKSQPAS